MKRVVVFLLLVAMIGGCKMRYGYLPRVHQWHAKEKPSAPRKKEDKPGIAVQPVPDAIPDDVEHVPGPDRVQDTIALPLAYPGIRSAPDHEPLPVTWLDSPPAEVKDTLIAKQDNEREEKRKNSILKGVFFVLLFATNVATVFSNSFLLFFFFSVFSIIMLLTVLEKRKYPGFARDERSGNEKNAYQSRNVLNTGLIMLGAGLALAVLGIFSFTDIMVVMGFLMLFAGLIISVVGLASMGASKSDNDSGIGIALVLVLSLLLLLVLALLGIFLLAILFF